MEGELEWEGEVDPGLVTRPRRSRTEKVGVEEETAENGAGVSNGRKKNGAEVNVESQRSVYLDASEGIESTDADVENSLGTLSWPGGEGKQDNGAGFRDQDVKIQNGCSIVENNKQSGIVETQPTSPLVYCGVQEIEKEKTEPVKSATEEPLPVRQDNERKQEVTEIDLEKIIEEQETHDLYCPNCHSCITKRVILRKRKRLSWVVEKDAKREKLSSIKPDLGVSAATSGDSEQSQEPEVFRCLSCFSFFIATASGFRLFRIFQRRGEGGNSQTQQPPPAQNLNAATSTSQFVEKPDEVTSAVGLGSETPLSGENNLRTEAERMLFDSSKSTVGLGSGTPHSKEDNETTESGKKHPGSDTKPYPKGVGTYFSSTMTNVNEENEMVLETQKTKYPNNVLSNVGKQGDVAEFNASEDGNYIILSSKDSTLLIGKDDGNPGQKVVSGTEKDFSGNGAILHAKEDEINGWNPSSNLSQNILGSDKVNPLKEVMAEPIEQFVSQTGQDPLISATPGVSSGSDTQIHIGDPRMVEARTREWDVLKSIVYGGLVESITSLGVVSSAAGSDATTLKIVALGLANLVAGLIVLADNLKELANDHNETLEPRAEEQSKYYRTLGRRANLRLHVVVAILCYIIFGIIPPVVYGFSFRKSDNKEYKLIAVAGASFLCILLLSIGKARVQRAPKPYIKTILYYISVGVAASGLAYVAGELVRRLLENTGLFDSTDAGTAPSPPSYLDMRPRKLGWGSS
ncbi:membrane protein of ER body-like protein isoform X2 [Aristolochia californica]|uniref:membrane protein of ER body-like protein isoform X2 n=1 Tax=Aristolochia californica TaxID=171875 RepID=UPI0035DC33A1